MRIISSELQLNTSHVKTQQRSLVQSVKSTTPEIKVATTNISDAGHQLNNSRISEIKDGLDTALNDPTLNLIRAMIFSLTGKEIKVLDLQSLMGSTDIDDSSTNTLPSVSNTDIDNATVTQLSYSEDETTTFNASGIIHTSDNKTVKFDLNLLMSYSYKVDLNTVSGHVAPRKTEDPLVLNFNGTAASLSSQRFKFDLNSDGSMEDINLLSGGNGFLAFDLNSDGKINNGSELFGSTSGNGFNELSRFDSDSNGWIDENDKDYSKLLIWRKDSTGRDELSSFSKNGVGAISLSSLSTPFALKDSDNALLGNIKASSIFLMNAGDVGIVQQIDVTI